MASVELSPQKAADQPAATAPVAVQEPASEAPLQLAAEGATCDSPVAAEELRSTESSQVLVAVALPTPSASAKPPIAPPPPAADVNAPRLSLFAIFKLFLYFGLRAWGGPVAQIMMMKEELVVQQAWITPKRFNRVLAVYQVLPGPEATELACYFGMLAGGRLGALAAGFGFMVPGLLLMLLASWLYATYGLDITAVRMAFLALQPAVLGMVFRAVHKIGEHAVKQEGSDGTDWRLATCTIVAVFESVMSLNFFLILAHCGLLYALLLQRTTAGSSWARKALGAFWSIAPIIGILVAIGIKGPLLDLMPVAIGVAPHIGRNAGSSFVVGLLGGALTFGGAYTAIPIIKYESVTVGHWLTEQQFLDGIAVGQVLPSPLVIFSTFVGYLASGIGGAITMTIGMFLPAFSFTLIGHELFERVVESKGVVMHALDGISAGVVGLIAVTAVQMLKTTIKRPVDAIIFICSLYALYASKNKYMPVIIVVAAALAGNVLMDAGIAGV